MASIRTARIVAAVSALPLTAALFSGVAVADNGGFADSGSNAGVTSVVGSGVGRDNSGNSSTTAQNAVGGGASNQSNTAQVNGAAPTAVNQGNTGVALAFGPLWW
ncbi:hypothetical protein [Streptomyces antibioticus]|uniref:Secreted protein n=1 Tax=Streptomyces antibioticus TaxID=1890 RepID=A0AAE7CLI7_STRAT|nr:hypothetical protein [Streptomyces antibioticus]MCX4738093.1 hypothetical protein [Streptomyces antibioticus]MCX5170112.1 hypothetical protein [Streptomyces antibioticus]OOQ50041.1 hypothetical protein AFM16_19235 [Streptomyces antibioticus]QIT45457.1 hypothetical protein HCX60_19535 [Streptomyces antibioticus]